MTYIFPGDVKGREGQTVKNCDWCGAPRFTGDLVTRFDGLQVCKEDRRGCNLKDKHYVKDVSKQKVRRYA